MTASKTSTRRIDSLERMNSSVNGNPRFRIHFTDGSVAETQSDAGFCYGLENRENFGVDVVVTWTRALHEASPGRQAMSRAEHLAWAKDRALAYLPDWQNAMASFVSDLGKHKDTAGHAVIELMMMHALSGLLNERTCRDLIEGTR